MGDNTIKERDLVDLLRITHDLCLLAGELKVNRFYILIENDFRLIIESENFFLEREDGEALENLKIIKNYWRKTPEELEKVLEFYENMSDRAQST